MLAKNDSTLMKGCIHNSHVAKPQEVNHVHTNAFTKEVLLVLMFAFCLLPVAVRL